MTDSGPASPTPTEGGIKRLMRRRRRIGRNQRHFGGKTAKSWAEYSSVTLTVTGDTSGLNRWAFILIGLSAPLLPFYFMAIAKAASETASAGWERAQQIAVISGWFLAPILIFAALLALSAQVRARFDRAEAAKRTELKEAE